MADRNIKQSIRKPRRAKGTPLYIHRNYYALGVIFVSAATWTFYEFWSQTQKLKNSIREGKLQFSPEYKEHITEVRLGFDPMLAKVL